MSKLSSVLLFFSLILSVPAFAKTGNWIDHDQIRVRILTAHEATGDLDTINAAIEIDLKDGWNSYWYAPGEAGLPPRLDWSASKNIKNAEILWPAPTRFDEGGFQTFGYTDHVILPVDITPAVINEDTDITITANIMVCNDVCIPNRFDLSLSLPSGTAKPSMEHKKVMQARDVIPSLNDTPSMRIKSMVAGKDKIAIAAFSQNQFKSPDVFAAIFENSRDDGTAQAMISKPNIVLDMNDRRNAMITLDRPEGIEDLNAFIQGKIVNIVLVDEDKNVQKEMDFSTTTTTK